MCTELSRQQEEHIRTTLDKIEEEKAPFVPCYNHSRIAAFQATTLPPFACVLHAGDRYIAVTLLVIKSPYHPG
jgi:hypothetical protein